MGNPDNKISDFVDIFKSWIPGRGESGNMSRDFWMPDHSCRVCYECDSQFTVFNRRHHCRLCGRVFCAKCTACSIPAPSDAQRSGGEDWERIRVCNYCFKQWQQGITAPDNNGTCNVPSPGLSPSPSATSLVSTKSTCTCNSSSSTVGSTPYSTGTYQRVPYTSGLNLEQSAQMDTIAVEHENGTNGKSTDATAATVYSSADQFGYCMNRSDDDDDEYGMYNSVSGDGDFCHADGYYGPVAFDEIDHMYGPHEMIHGEDQIDSTITCCPYSPENFDIQGVEKIKNDGGEAYGHDGNECEAPSYNVDGAGADAEPVDFENNGLLWLPPEPEDVEDEREALLFDDEDDEAPTGEWGYLRPSNSFGSGEYRCKDKSNANHRKAMKNVVEGHFRALVAQLLQVENLAVGDEDDKESWLEIITSLSWEAATLLESDTSKGGGMDPGGYVKVKCIACGRRSESMVVKGVVCKKNVAHRRMMSKIDKPRFLILGGALEYQRVSNHLSSVDTLLQQEMDHLKMAVAKIDAHHPNVLLVEKSVSRYAQEYLLAKGISLVLNIKKPLLERIARCIGSHIVPSIDHLTSHKLGYCDLFHVEKFFEEHGSAGQGRKKLIKTLMFFEGCPKPLGYTILLKGAHGNELKKVKHVVQYGVFAAYHLALETSFLADEGASLPEIPLSSPITVALPDKPSRIGRSISTIPGFTVPGTEIQKSDTNVIPEMPLLTDAKLVCKLGDVDDSICHSKNPSSKPECRKPASNPTENIDSSLTSFSPVEHNIYGPSHNNYSLDNVSGKNVMKYALSSPSKKTNIDAAGSADLSFYASFETTSALAQAISSSKCTNGNALSRNRDGYGLEEIESSKEEFPPSPSDHQSILVSLSTRCVWKGTVCERAHLFRIKYYGSFDKPLGRFLRDHLFDQNYRCGACEMPSEAHVYCYTHQQGSLMISVKKLPEFLLPGEREGKIWMWHRCLRCPRISGFPPATRRVVMSDAAWGLSFGKFLELSFSNHATASRVASCGHSLQRDCLRFYGFGRMVACFRYASIHVHSVYLPPSKVEFNCDNHEWIQEEANQVGQREELLFKEVQNAIHQISEKILGAGSQNGNQRSSELSRLRIKELERLLQKDKEQFEESMRNMLHKEMKSGQVAVDILEINKLRRQILFQSYVWDQLLINAVSLSSTDPQETQRSCISKNKDNRVNSVENLVEMDLSPRSREGFSSCDSVIADTQSELNFCREGNDSIKSQPFKVHETKELGEDLHLRKEAECCISSSENINGKLKSNECGQVVGRALSEGSFPIMDNLSDSLDAAWTGNNQLAEAAPKENVPSSDPSSLNMVCLNSSLENSIVDKGGIDVGGFAGFSLAAKGPQYVEDSSPVGLSFSNIYSSFKRSSLVKAQKLNISEYNPIYVSVSRELERKSGARLLLPVSNRDTVIPVYDDEPTSIIAYALYSSDYRQQMSELEKQKDIGDSTSLPLLDSVNLLSFNSSEESTSDIYRSLGSIEESILSISGSRGSRVLDPLLYTKDFHARVSFTDDGLQGKMKYVVTSYYAKRFEALRKMCCPTELDFIRSLSRCKKWGAQGGKSNVFFAKTLDDRFIIKQVTKTELESFIKFGPAYFKYLSDSISTGSPTCLAKILGIYQVSSKHLKGGKELKMDVLVMENLLFRRNVVRLYDLKGSSRSRYNPDTSGSNKVLLDQNLIEAMPTSPIFVGNKAKRLLERAVWNDTSFLASVDVMDYSLLVGVDEERHELVVGIIDFMRQYTWDKHLETWVKASGILGGAKNTTPTVISPQQYKKRFRKAMTAYFLMVPDQWSPPRIIPSGSRSDLCEENLQSLASVD